MYNTLQEIFDASYIGLMRQGFRQATEDINGLGADACRYRSGNGLKCAVGHLIDDSKYAPEVEGTTLAVMLSYDSR